MDRKTYSKQYNEYKQLHREAMRDAIKRFEQENPQRFAELQAQAKYDLAHPTPRIVTRYPTQLPTHKVDIDTLIMQFRAGRKHYFISTIDRWNDTHLYSELLSSKNDAEEILTRQHPKFVERSEHITKTEVCTCPLCQSLN